MSRKCYITDVGVFHYIDNFQSSNHFNFQYLPGVVVFVVVNKLTNSVTIHSIFVVHYQQESADLNVQPEVRYDHTFLMKKRRMSRHGGIVLGCFSERLSFMRKIDVEVYVIFASFDMRKFAT